MAEQSASFPPGSEDIPVFPAYEEVAQGILESLDKVGLSLEDIQHDVEPSTGERTFECTVRLHPTDPPSRYHAHVRFSWDALMTYIALYGAGADCEMYHDDDDVHDCPHQHLIPQPLIELEAEFILGDGGYELQDVQEATGWLETVQSVLSKAFKSDDRPSVHLGIASLGTTLLVEKFTAEYSWLLDFENTPDYDGVAEQVHAALAVVPQLADRLPI